MNSQIQIIPKGKLNFLPLGYSVAYTMCMIYSNKIRVKYNQKSTSNSESMVTSPINSICITSSFAKTTYQG